MIMLLLVSNYQYSVVTALAQSDPDSYRDRQDQKHAVHFCLKESQWRFL